jgi:hypothetical protein
MVFDTSLFLTIKFDKIGIITNHIIKIHAFNIPISNGGINDIFLTFRFKKYIE